MLRKENAVLSIPGRRFLCIMIKQAYFVKFLEFLIACWLKESKDIWLIDKRDDFLPNLSWKLDKLIVIHSNYRKV